MTTVRLHTNRKYIFEIHDDEMNRDELGVDEERNLDESRDVGDEEDGPDGDHYSEASEDSDRVVDASVQEDIVKFQQTFGPKIQERYRLINRIGEGTFSTVYKAEDLKYDNYDNEWDLEEKENKWVSPPLKRRRLGDDEPSPSSRRPKYVAIKKIYVTSSPSRIYNELELLKDLRGFDSVCPLITAFRSTDQVVAVLPYFRHTDFREYFRQMTVPDIQIYLRSLFSALAAVHSRGIIHRDIKPTNFLYEPAKRRGVLVDFGLAERQGLDGKPCMCLESPLERKRRINASVTAGAGPANGFPKHDSRPSRRANRAGTRGFRAPEVLLKCTEQTTKIDIWSAGVMLLTILSKRFPFFNSTDDVEAMIEIATIFGTRRMRACALLHGTVFETTIPTIGNGGFSLEKIILWSTCRNAVPGSGEGSDGRPLTEGEKLAVHFLERCFELDPNKRISADEALEHDFLREILSEEEEDDNNEDEEQDDEEAGEDEEMDIL